MSAICESLIVLLQAWESHFSSASESTSSACSSLRFMIQLRSLRKSEPWSGLVKKSASISSVGQYAMDTFLPDVRWLCLFEFVTCCIWKLCVSDRVSSVVCRFFLLSCRVVHSCVLDLFKVKGRSFLFFTRCCLEQEPEPVLERAPGCRWLRQLMVLPWVVLFTCAVSARTSPLMDHSEAAVDAAAGIK